MATDTLDRYDGTEIAVIGMAGRFPGARDVATFWENLRHGIESIKFFTDEELRASGVNPAELREPNFVKAGFELEGSDLFDAAFFGFSPMEAAIMDPQHRVFLECAWGALEDAGYNAEAYPGAIGVFAGSGMNNYLMYNLISNPDLIASVGKLMVWTTGNDKDFLPTRVSYLLNLKGPSISIQTACSTSLVAIHVACQSLLNNECDMCLAGGVTIFLPQDRGYRYREGEIMSPDGHCRAFDAKAKGTVFGSGAGVVVLKRLANAVRDRDNIYAVVKGSAINNDGSMKVGYTAPSVEGQARVITEALEVAGVDPGTISYVEAHGSGTPVGDPIEIAALTQAFRTCTRKKAFCGIGSLKTNVGHLDTAAGVAGFIKTVLALKHKELPPSLYYETPNSEIDFANSPFFVNAKLSKWSTNGTPRRAGVSSLGVGGTNAHVILEEVPDLGPTSNSRSWQLLLQSARSYDALNRTTANLAKHLKQHPEVNLADVAYTLQVGRRFFGRRRMLVCRDVADAVTALESLDPQRVLTQSLGEGDRSVVFMFPGQGSQYVNMGRELYQQEPVFRQELDRCAGLLQSHLRFDLRQALYPGEGQFEEATERLTQTAVAQPAIFAIEYALARLWMSWGVRPEAMIGHSIGEYVAACLAGVFSLEDALRLVAARGNLIQQLPAGAMLVASLPEEQLKPLLGEELSLAAVNGPSLSVASGAFEAVEALQTHLIALGVACRRLHTSHAFHSKMMDPILEPFAEEVRKAKANPPQIPYISNITGSWVTAAQVKDPSYWVEHLRQTVRFADSLQELFKETNRVLLEVGPQNTLSTFARQLSAGIPQPPLILSSLCHAKDSQSDAAFLLSALGRLWLTGVPIDWSGFYGDEQRRRVPLPPYSFEHQRYWIDPGTQVHAVTSSNGSKKRRDIADWFYLPSWKETVPARIWHSNDLETENSWLVFADECGLGSRLVERLAFRQGLPGNGHGITTVTRGQRFEKLGDGTYSLNAGQPAGYDALLKELAEAGRFPQRIVHLWNVTSLELGEHAIEDVEKGLTLSFYSLLYLAQALGRRNLSQPLHIGVVSNGMQQVAGETAHQPLKAALLGPTKVIPHEFPNITCTSVDIALPEVGCWQEERLIEQLLLELSKRPSDTDNVVAYRGSRRWVQTFVPFRIDQTPEKSLLRNKGTYLITGGLGGLGLVIAEHLANTVQANLVLVGRRGLPPRDSWGKWLASHDNQDQTSVRIRKVEGFEKMGATVFIATADVADANQICKIVDQAKNRFGGIQGVIHAAGLIRDGIIQLKSREAAEQVFAPKVTGTLVLDAALRDEKLDFFVLFSSCSAISGPAGQVDYAAANAFLDAFARQRASRDSTHTLAINWGAWQEVGMAAELAARTGSGNGSFLKPVGQEVPHPLLDRCVVDSNDEKVYSTEFRAGRQWVLDEHRLKSGEVLLPGTALLELARAALGNHPGNGAVEIGEVFFLTPFVLKAVERRELQVALKKHSNSFKFVITSGPGAMREHVRGTIALVDAPNGRRQSITEIRSRCTVSEWVPVNVEHDHVDFGQRWNNLKRVSLGSQEALAAIELPETFRADLEHYKLHPALLDRATGAALSLINGYNPLEDFYLPFSYGKVRVNTPLPAKLFSHIRHRDHENQKKGTAVFDITILDEEGRELVEISDFVVRKVTAAAITAGEGQAAQDQPGGLEHEINPDDGAEAFVRLLSRDLLPQIAVAPQDPDSLINAAGANKDKADSHSGGQARPAVAQHPRPDLPTRYISPSMQPERQVAQVWQELLGIQEIGIHDDFFELGGNSLLIVTVHSRLQQTFGITFPVAKMFQHPTISTMANYLSQGLGDKPSYENLRDRAERQREALGRQKQLAKGMSTHDQSI